MAQPDLPPEVLRFIDERIESVPHLEALLILWQSGIDWTATDMARRIYLSDSATQAVLTDLQRANLVTSVDGVRFAYEPGWDETQSLMARVARTYQSNVTRIATLIHHRVPSSVRAFARAFDFKKEG